jgi:hypothetical protein
MLTPFKKRKTERKKNILTEASHSCIRRRVKQEGGRLLSIETTGDGLLGQALTLFQKPGVAQEDMSLATKRKSNEQRAGGDTCRGDNALGEEARIGELRALVGKQEAREHWNGELAAANSVQQHFQKLT